MVTASLALLWEENAHRVLAMLPKQMQLHMIRGLMVGAYYYEWNLTGIVVLRKAHMKRRFVQWCRKFGKPHQIADTST